MQNYDIVNAKHPLSPNGTRFLKKKSEGKTEGSKFLGFSETHKMLKKENLQQLHYVNALNEHLEELLEQQAKELTDVVETNSKFISIIAHDIRSPFISILAAMDILKHTLKDCNISEAEQHIDIVSNSAYRALDLLQGLLEWTIAQNKQKSFNPVKINLQELLQGVLESIRFSLDEKQIVLHCFISAGLNVTADINMVQTIFRNLITNAVKFSYTGGEISISAQESASFVDISVKDNGIGIADQRLQKLFKAGEFQSSEGTNNEKGSGLGLLICKEFVEVHGGNIQVQSEPGKGSEFRFMLPHYI